MPRSSLFRRLPSDIRAAISRLRRNTAGNVLIMFGFAMIPMVFAAGMGVDYTRAAKLRTKMNALADAAALSAVTTAMMNQDDTTATLTAKNMFNTQAAMLTGAIYDPSTFVVAITHPNGPGSRTVTVSYSALSQNSFGGILGSPTIAIGGTSTANNMVAPNIDFYMLLDTSPSMLLPATTAGLATMITKANGCAFACHQTNLTYSSNNKELVCDSNNKNCIDYFTVAVNNGVTLRTDLLHEAVQNLTTLATNMSTSNKAKYRMGLFSFDKTFQQIWPSTAQIPNVDSNLSNVSNNVVNAKVLTYYMNNWLTSTNNDGDKGTATRAVFDQSAS